MPTGPLAFTDPILTARLARTVCEIDPGARNQFDVAVLLEAVGQNDRTARAAGWADLFALSRAVSTEIDFLQTDEERSELLPLADHSAGAPPFAYGAVLVQQAAWLLMVAVTFVGGLSVWAVEVLPASLERALAIGILGSLVLSGGVQYAAGRRLIFHISQHDLIQAQGYLRHVLVWGTLLMGAGALAVGFGLWMASGEVLLAPVVGAAYFALHGNYRVAVVPLLVVHDLPGILLSLAGSVVLLLITYGLLLAAGISSAGAGVAAQLAALLMLWLACSLRARWLIRPDREEPLPADPDPPRGLSRAERVLRPRPSVLMLDALPWLAAGLLYYAFLFGIRPIAWTLPRPERLIYETGFDLGIIGIIPAAVMASWALHLYYREWRGRLLDTPVSRAAGVGAAALASFDRLTWRCRLWGIAAAAVLLPVAEGLARLTALPPSTVAVLEVTLVGTTTLLPAFLLASGLLFSLAALRDVISLLLLGLAAQLVLGIQLARFGEAIWMPMAFFLTAAAVGEVTVWRARRAVRTIDRLYYAAF